MRAPWGGGVGVGVACCLNFTTYNFSYVPGIKAKSLPPLLLHFLLPPLPFPLSLSFLVFKDSDNLSGMLPRLSSENLYKNSF